MDNTTPKQVERDAEPKHFVSKLLEDPNTKIETYTQFEPEFGPMRDPKNKHAYIRDKGENLVEFQIFYTNVVSGYAKKAKIIDNLVCMFEAMGRQDIVSNLERQLPEARKPAYARKGVLKEDEVRFIQVSAKSGCANIPMAALWDEALISDGEKGKAMVEMIYKDNKPDHYIVRWVDKTDEAHFRLAFGSKVVDK